MENMVSTDEIVALITPCGKKFQYEIGEENPAKRLLEVTKEVPDEPGLYLVFSEKKIDLKEKSHLYFLIEGLDVELLYFGKAGGVSNTGSTFTQGLKGRINNVISDSSRNLKDVRRGIYWNLEMLDNNESRLIVYYALFENPIQLEKAVYQYLESNSLLYPRMNKKLGRKKK
ncbi:MAG: hypothetical protein RL108_69 [Bacteroidota bacterium]|jgi:hypothetical protein